MAQRKRRRRSVHHGDAAATPAHTPVLPEQEQSWVGKGSALLVQEKRPRSTLRRLFDWYRRAVLSPATEKERDEWQKDSF